MAKVKEMMKKIVTTEKDVSIRDAARMMHKKRIGSLVLVHGEEIIGIMTERDVVENIDSLDKKISKIVSKKLITTDANESIEDAARLLGKNKIKRLLVTEKGMITGIITVTDLMMNSDIINETEFLLGKD